MKKIIAAILALAAVFSLAACGNKTENPGETQVQDATGGAGMVVIPEEETKPLTPPTEEEVAALQEYANVLAALKKYEETGVLTFTDAEGNEITTNNGMLYSNAAFKTCYDLINNAVVVDKYANTQYAADYDIEWDRQAVLDKFACVEDVQMYKRTYKFAKGEAVEINPLLREDMHIDYHPNGQVKYVADNGLYDDTDCMGIPYLYPELADPSRISQRYFYYDDSGNISQVVYGTSIGTPEYDAKGRMIALHFVTKEGKTFDISYAYNDRGQVTEIKGYTYSITSSYEDLSGYPYYRYTFEYDDQGRMIRAEKRAVFESPDLDPWHYVREYSYDPSGKKITAVDTCTKDLKDHAVRVDKLTYDLDDAGHVVMLTVECGDWIGIDGDEAGVVLEEAEYGTVVYRYGYGDYWIYEPGMYAGVGLDSKLMKEES